MAASHPRGARAAFAAASSSASQSAPALASSASTRAAAAAVAAARAARVASEAALVAGAPRWRLFHPPTLARDSAAMQAADALLQRAAGAAGDASEVPDAVADITELALLRDVELRQYTLRLEVRESPVSSLFKLASPGADDDGAAFVNGASRVRVDDDGVAFVREYSRATHGDARGFELVSARTRGCHDGEASARMWEVCHDAPERTAPSASAGAFFISPARAVSAVAGAVRRASNLVDFDGADARPTNEELRELGGPDSPLPRAKPSPNDLRQHTLVAITRSGGAPLLVTLALSCPLHLYRDLEGEIARVLASFHVDP